MLLHSNKFSISKKNAKRESPGQIELKRPKNSADRDVLSNGPMRQKSREKKGAKLKRPKEWRRQRKWR